MHKYQRISHLQESNPQEGDNLKVTRWRTLLEKDLIITEKVDGANVGISFENDKMVLQSRGHVLRGGPREEQFALFKQWAATYEWELKDVLGEKHVMFGEWCYAKHTVFYDALPSYFLEFDILDKKREKFLSSLARADMLSSLHKKKIINSTPLLHEGTIEKLSYVKSLITNSKFKSEDWRSRLKEQALASEQDPDVVWSQTDQNDEMEGVVIKWENDDFVQGVCKFVRSTFTNTVSDQDTHWIDRKIVRNVVVTSDQ